MAYAQQINQEQEALGQQPALKLSLESQVFLAFKHKTPNRYRLLDKLVRAYVDPDWDVSDKRKYLSEKSKKLLVTILKKIFNRETPLLNHKYISKATRCKSDQNARILKELRRILFIQYWNVFTNSNGQNFLRHYTFEIHPSIVQELKDAGAWSVEFCPDFNRNSYNNKNISNEIKIRSNRANFPNSNFNSKNADTKLVENSSEVAKGSILRQSVCNADARYERVKTLQEPQSVETANPTPATVTPIQTKTRPANKRKTKTREEQKQRRTCHVIRNGFLGGGKHLSEIQPYLTDEICEKLRSGSGRAFTNKAIKEITKAIAVSEKGSKAFFYHINGLVAYLIPALMREKRCPERTNSDNYYTLAGMSEKDKLWHEREKYLAEVEEEAIRHVNPKNHFRAKLANMLKHAKAYEFLLAFVNAEIEDNRLQITLNRTVELSEQELDIVLFQARAVFNNWSVNGDGQYVEFVEYVVNAANSNFRELEKEQEPTLPKGKWGKICAAFVAEYGMNMYKHWISPLHAEEDNALIMLSSNSGMILDRIMDKYWQRLSYYSEMYNINLSIKFE